MFIVRFTSGLGNQMFQYCFTLLLKKLYPDTPVKADLTWFYANNDHHGFELVRIFGQSSGFSLEEASKSELFRVTGLLPNLLMPKDMTVSRNGKAFTGRFRPETAMLFEKVRRYPNRLLREITGKKRAPFRIDEGLDANAAAIDNDAFYRRIASLDPGKDYYFTGFFISERFFAPVLKEARRAFLFPPFTDEKNRSLSTQIKGSYSVSLHVRRGDYLTVYQDSFIALGPEYYRAAIREICERTGKRQEELSFFLFSDDPDFVREAFNYLDNAVIIANNTGADSFRDMQLMALCRHNIIANSTFSQWAALLNENEGHLTIYPKAYLKHQDNEKKNLENWVMIGS